MESSATASDRILDSAEHLFATKGFSATTIKMIATESGQNSALIYYYYDSKASLYSHVLDRMVRTISEHAAGRIKPASSPEEIIRAVVESQVAVLTAKPHLPLLLARELIDWKAAHAEPAIRSLSEGLFERLRLAVESGQESGRFRRDISSRFAAISVVAQVGYLVLARPIAGVLLGRGLAGPTSADIHDFGAHAAEFALAALRNPAASTNAA